MRKTNKFLSSIFTGQAEAGFRAFARVGCVLVLLVSFVNIAFAANNVFGRESLTAQMVSTFEKNDTNNNEIIVRPVVKYNSAGLRDPFVDLFQKSMVQQNDQITPGMGKQNLMPNLETLKVQGVIWGGKFPQAIINHKVLSVGGLIDGFEIVSIEKSVITLNFNGRIVNLVIPGSAPVLQKGDKEEK